jgi:hypothetical protein
MGKYKMSPNSTGSQLLKSLRNHVPDNYAMAYLDQLETAMLLMPMRIVLDKIYGDSVVEKAKRVGVSRNTWYAWKRGEIRPNKHQAKRLQTLTDIPAERFQGRR